MPNKTFFKYFKNSSWMMAENILKIVSSFFVAIYIARFLKPEAFGVLTYVVSIVFVLMALSRLGMETILVRELVKTPKLAKGLIGTAFILMLLGSLASILIVGLFIYLFENDTEISLYLFIMSLGLLFQPFFVIDYNFQSKIKAKYSSIAKSLAYIVSSLLKIYLVTISAELIYFVIAYVFDFIIIGLFLFVMHLYQKESPNIFSVNMLYIRELLHSAFPLVISSLTMSLYMAIDKLLIKYFLGLHSLGVYSAAVKMYEGWLFFPIVVGASLLPALVKLKQGPAERYEKNLIRVFSLVIWGGIIIALISSFFGEWIILYTFGVAYSGANSSLVIIMWALAFIGAGTISYAYFTVEKIEHKLVIRTFVALTINLILDVFLIPIYGIEGAAIATLISVVIAYYLIDAFDPQTRLLMRLKTKAFLLHIT